MKAGSVEVTKTMQKLLFWLIYEVKKGALNFHSRYKLERIPLCLTFEHPRESNPLHKKLFNSVHTTGQMNWEKLFIHMSTQKFYYQ